jgi:cyclase
VDVAAQISDWPVAAILYTDVAKDGMLQGPNVQHTRLLAEAGRVPVIASGGVGSLADLVAGVIEGKASAVLAASIFHYGEHSIAEARAALAAAGLPVRG